GAGIALWAAPWFFNEVLENRYTDGLRLMPMTFVFAIWYSLVTVGQNYLWVAERGKLVAVAIGVGLVVNVVLNLFLLPVWGLFGAVFSTLLAHLVLLVCLWYAMRRHGYSIDRSTFFVSILPATLLAGPMISMACVAVVCFVSVDARTWIRDGQRWISNKLASRFAAV
ncbi:MAG: polysaccharide biosynthesis C-terminal domain-containing protein, partial [Rubripirellula sp.]